MLLLLNAGSNINDLYYTKYWRCGDGDSKAHYKCFRDTFDGAGFNMANKDDADILSKISLFENGDCPLPQLPQNPDKSDADLKNLFLKRGYELLNNLSSAFMQNYIGAGANTENCLVLGMTIDGNPVTRNTPGFEKAITTLDELNSFLNSSKLSFNNKTHLSILEFLLKQFELKQEHEKTNLCRGIREVLCTPRPLVQLSLFAVKNSIVQKDITPQVLDRLTLEQRTKFDL
jgi:hypothetical protein